MGRYFDEDAPSFTEWPSVRHLPADFADALETGGRFHGRVPPAVDGVLLWEEPLAPAAGAGGPEPSTPATGEATAGRRT